MAQERGNSGHLPDPGQAVYGISVAAGLAGIGVQTLRLYERHGLLTPARSDGGTRRYSGNDLARLRRITDLVATGVNLAGIRRILDLEDANADLHADNDRLNAANDRLNAANDRLQADNVRLRDARDNSADEAQTP